MRSLAVLWLAARARGCSPVQEPPNPARVRKVQRELGRRPTTDRELREPASPRLAAELARLEREAGIERTRDPPAPSGDLRADLDSFTTREACIRDRAPKDT